MNSEQPTKGPSKDPVKDTTKDVASFRIELKLQPEQSGQRELKNWPASTFTPDFAVAASGAVRVEIAGEVIGSRDGKILVVERSLALRLQQDINFWLPDYVGGFALNLGRAVESLTLGAVNSKAGFMDEPLGLEFRRISEAGKIITGFTSDSSPVREVELEEKDLISKVRRALQDFRRQLLDLNPELARQQDVLELTQYIQKLG